MTITQVKKLYTNFKSKRAEMFYQIKEEVESTAGSATLIDDGLALEFYFLDHKFKLVGLGKNNFEIIDFVLSNVEYSDSNYPFEKWIENKDIKAKINGNTAYVNDQNGNIKVFGETFVEALFDYVKIKNPANFI